MEISDGGKVGGLSTRWKKPYFGVTKINTDATWCKDTLRSGIGWVARDFAGVLQGAGGLGSLLFMSADAAEAAAIKEALEFCIAQKFDKVIIESDAKPIVQMIRKEIAFDYRIDCILGDIEVLARKIPSVEFVFVPRVGNLAAHSVAKFVSKSGKAYVWDCIGPEFLFNVLAQDINISLRI